LNPASPQPAGTCQFLVEKVSRSDMETAGWPLRCGRGKNIKIPKNISRKEKTFFYSGYDIFY